MAFQTRWRHSKPAPNHHPILLALGVPAHHCLPRKDSLSEVCSHGYVAGPWLAALLGAKGQTGSSLQEAEPQPASLSQPLAGWH